MFLVCLDVHPSKYFAYAKYLLGYLSRLFAWVSRSFASIRVLAVASTWERKPTGTVIQ